MSDFLTIDTSSGITFDEKVVPLPIYNETHPMLFKAIPEYTTPLPNQPMNTLVKRMKGAMGKYAGIGLSANQCGVFERVFLIGADEFQLVCINPKVIETSTEIEAAEEGCLSFPGLFLKIPRPKWIIAEFLDENGQTQQIKLDGVTARCYLHELDHMNGIRFVDYIKPLALRMARKRQSKIIKKVKRKNDR
jgi:peptide deformylase